MLDNCNWYVYFAKCLDETIYIGVSPDVNKRIEAHNKGQGAKYTKGRLPVFLAHKEGPYTHSVACQKEYEYKQLSRLEKLYKIEGGKR